MMMFVERGYMRFEGEEGASGKTVDVTVHKCTLFQLEGNKLKHNLLLTSS